MINSMMFKTEMENLELDLNLGSSDLLFSDDLLNLPLETVQQEGFAFVDNFYDDLKKDNFKKETEALVTDDILDKIMKEVKLPTEEQMLMSGGSWQSDSAYESGLFEEQPSPSTSSFCSTSDDEDSTQTLIEEMEEFLVQHETSTNVDVEMESIVPEMNETTNAEKLLDALMNGNISIDESMSNSINNISEITTEDGQKILIVITNDQVRCSTPVSTIVAESSPFSNCMTPSPSTSYSNIESPAYTDDTEDSDWSPATPVVEKKNKKAVSKIQKRGPYKRPGKLQVKDKKERKKLQNVVAARRYRDKKKNEQNTIDQEEERLTTENVALKAKLSDVESEVKTLKKLMLELGLVRVKGVQST